MNTDNQNKISIEILDKFESSKDMFGPVNNNMLIHSRMLCTDFEKLIRCDFLEDYPENSAEIRDIDLKSRLPYILAQEFSGSWLKGAKNIEGSLAIEAFKLLPINKEKLFDKIEIDYFDLNYFVETIEQGVEFIGADLRFIVQSNKHRMRITLLLDGDIFERYSKLVSNYLSKYFSK